MPRGALVVLEGLDRAGKTTQCKLLQEYLQSERVNVEIKRFPVRTSATGLIINSYLSGKQEAEDHVIHLLFSANRWEAAPEIEAALAAGTTVIIDRYYYSGIVYSAAKRNPKLSLEWCRAPDVGLPRPDLCVFLDLSAEDAAKRGGYGTEKYENKEMQDQVRELFKELMRRAEGGDIVSVDAGGVMEAVQERIREVIWGVVQKVKNEDTPLRYVQSW